MEDQEHLEFLDFMTEQELKAETIEANNELAEDNNCIGDKYGFKYTQCSKNRSKT